MGRDNTEDYKKLKKQRKIVEEERDFRLDELIYDEDHRGYDEQVKIRSALYSYIIKEYGRSLHEDLKSKRFLKKVFFWVIVGIMVAVIFAFGFALIRSFILIKNAENNGNELVPTLLLQAITTVSAVLTSILVLPKIIANYLFNPKEERAIRTMVDKIQKYDASMKPRQEDELGIMHYEDAKGPLFSENLDELEDLAEVGVTTEEDAPEDVVHSQRRDAPEDKENNES